MFGLIMLLLIAGAAAIYWTAFWLMILVGIVHHNWLTFIPAIGIEDALLLALVAGLSQLPTLIYKEVQRYDR